MKTFCEDVILPGVAFLGLVAVPFLVAGVIVLLSAAISPWLIAPVFLICVLILSASPWIGT